MKKFLALAVLATTTTSFAASERSITDIMYLPTSGTTFGLTEFASIGRSIKGEDSDDDASISGVGLQQTIGHTFTDRFLLSASINYLTAEYDPEEGSKTDIDGISDPTITAKFRAYDEEYALDFFANALISIGDKEIKDNGDENNMQGGNALDLGVQFGKKAQNFSWAVTGSVRSNFDRTIDADSAGDIDAKSNNDYKLRGDILNKLAEKSYLRSHVDVEFEDAVEDDDSSATIYSSTTVYTIGSEYQHVIDADLLLKGGIDLAKYNHDAGTVENEIEARINIGALYQF